MKKTFYRVCNTQTKQGLWYDFGGNFTGLIHDRFSFCTNHSLKMNFDDILVGWLSATESLDDLWAWFSMGDIIELQKMGWFVYRYESEEYRWYEKFNHWTINQKTSKLTAKIKIFKTK